MSTSPRARPPAGPAQSGSVSGSAVAIVVVAAILLVSVVGALVMR